MIKMTAVALLCWCRCSDRDGCSSHLRSSPQAGPLFFREPMPPCGHLPPSLEEPWNFLVNICRQNITRSPQMVNLNLIFDFPVNFYSEMFTRNPSVPIPTFPSQRTHLNVPIPAYPSQRPNPNVPISVFPSQRDTLV